MIFDAHFHVIDPRYPLVANQGYLPAPFTCDDYRAAVEGLGVAGGAVVSASFQGFDQTYLLDALSRLGPSFVGVTRLPTPAADEEVLRLAGAGVRALRVNLRRGRPSGSFDDLARRVHDLAGWHVEIYADSSQLAALAPTLARLPQIVVDHLGLSAAGLPEVLRLVERGACVKASGFGRVDLDVAGTLRRVAAVNPEALLFGTDLPSTRAPRPFSPADVDLLAEALGDDGLVRAALWDNAVRLYRPALSPGVAAG